jgi:hypothetical protein
MDHARASDCPTTPGRRRRSVHGRDQSSQVGRGGVRLWSRAAASATMKTDEHERCSVPLFVVQQCSEGGLPWIGIWV